MVKLLELNEIYIKGINSYRLKNINLSIYQGEKIALLGKSGSGKSTLISVANGSIKPSQGSVKWKSKGLKDISRMEASQIATLWQDLRLINELNVNQNINAGALAKHNLFWAIGNLSGIVKEKKSISCLKASGLPTKLINSPINKLSGGQKQRVAIARLLRQEAQLILADEPMSSLDPVLAKNILQLLVFSKSFESIYIPQTCLISLHQPELAKYFTRVIGLQNGELVVDLPTNNLKASQINWLY